MKITTIIRRCAVGLGVLYLAGCAHINESSLSLFTTKVDSFLLVNGQLLKGNVFLMPDRSGRVAFSGGEGNINSCNGTLHYSGTNAGEIDLRCNDTSSAVLKMTLISETRGFAYGSTGAMPVNLAFGLTEAEAQAYLGQLPEKK